MKTINATLRSIVPPEAFHVTTGGDEERIIDDRTQEYLAGVRERLGMQATKWHVYLEMRYFGLTTRFGGESDDKLVALVFADEVLAGCLDIRTSSNLHAVSFFAGEVTDTAEQLYTDLMKREVQH